MIHCWIKHLDSSSIPGLPGHYFSSSRCPTACRDAWPNALVARDGIGWDPSPGYEPAALAEAVREDGRVHGIDNGDDVLAMARDHCADSPQVTMELGVGAELPVSDESFDAAVASLVSEYAPIVDTAAAVLHRALRPGGQAALMSTDWDSTVWLSTDADRMDRAIEAYKDIDANPRLGSQLTAFLRDGGFSVEHVEPYSKLATDLGNYAGLLLERIKGLLEGDGRFDRSEIDAWEGDLRELDDADETFSNATYYRYIARKPRERKPSGMSTKDWLWNLDEPSSGVLQPNQFAGRALEDFDAIDRCIDRDIPVLETGSVRRDPNTVIE